MHDVQVYDVGYDVIIVDLVENSMILKLTNEDVEFFFNY